MQRNSHNAEFRRSHKINSYAENNCDFFGRIFFTLSTAVAYAKSPHYAADENCSHMRKKHLEKNQIKVLLVAFHATYTKIGLT